MLDPLDVDGFTNKIIELIHNPEKMTRASVRNVDKANEYEETILQMRRNEFYGQLKAIALN